MTLRNELTPKFWDLFVVSSISGFSLAAFEPLTKNILATQNRWEAQGATRYLSDALTELCLAQNLALEGLRTIAICTGPGSFTGIRVGLAWALGLCSGLTQEISWIECSTLTLCAQHIQEAVVLTGTRTQGFLAEASGSVKNIQYQSLDAQQRWKAALPMPSHADAEVLGAEKTVQAAWNELALRYEALPRLRAAPEARYYRASTAEEVRMQQQQSREI